MIKVFSGTDDAENYYLHSLLTAQGVRATILGEHLTAVRGHLPFTESTTGAIWAHPEDITQANQIIDDYNESAAEKPTTTSPWTCPGCETQIEAQFTQCWNCQMKRTGNSGNDEQG